MPSLSSSWRLACGGAKENGEKKLPDDEFNDGEDDSLSDGLIRTEGNRSCAVRILRHQALPAQLLKLVVLFVLSVTHTIYTAEFLRALSVFDAYTDEVRAYQSSPAARVLNERHGITEPDVAVARLYAVIDLLDDYKKNLWMSVGAMCVALSTACYLLLVEQQRRATHASSDKGRFIVALRLFDLFAFLGMPALLASRAHLVRHLETVLQPALVGVSRMVAPQRLMNELRCTVAPREQMPFCSSLLLSTVFPVLVLEFLVALALLTALYIGLAYLIEWCIRHFFPPNQTTKLHFRQLVPFSIAVKGNDGRAVEKELLKATEKKPAPVEDRRPLVLVPAPADPSLV